MSIRERDINPSCSSSALVFTSTICFNQYISLLPPTIASIISRTFVCRLPGKAENHPSTSNRVPTNFAHPCRDISLSAPSGHLDLSSLHPTTSTQWPRTNMSVFLSQRLHSYPADQTRTEHHLPTLSPRRQYTTTAAHHQVHISPRRPTTAAPRHLQMTTTAPHRTRMPKARGHTGHPKHSMDRHRDSTDSLAMVHRSKECTISKDRHRQEDTMTTRGEAAHPTASVLVC